MEINNFSIIEPLMHFNEDRSTFYFIQLIKRRKDKGNEDMERGERLIKAYFIEFVNRFSCFFNKIIKMYFGLSLTSVLFICYTNKKRKEIK